MKHEKSCGALVLHRGTDGKDYVLMIRHRQGGHRSFPKGHIREIYDETAVKAHIRSDFRETVHYAPMPGVKKEVVYFLAKTEQEEIHPREGEIAEVEWIPLDAAETCLTYENDKTILRAAMKRLQAERESGKDPLAT